MSKRRKRRSAPDGRCEENILVLVSPEAKKFPLLAPAKEGDVGYDLYTSADTFIRPGAALPPTDVPTGLRIKLSAGTWGMILPRSGTHCKFPTLQLCSAPIDSGYTGPLCPRFRNLGKETVLVKRGERLTQLVLFGAIVPKAVSVSALPKTLRGSGRYGSTGR